MGVSYDLDEMRPRPPIKANCKRCRVLDDHVKNNQVIVSPSGLAHVPWTTGNTYCGIDATGDKWWWPL